jgi:hypothetical protein
MRRVGDVQRSDADGQSKRRRLRRGPPVRGSRGTPERRVVVTGAGRADSLAWFLTHIVLPTVDEACTDGREHHLDIADEYALAEALFPWMNPVIVESDRWLAPAATRAVWCVPANAPRVFRLITAGKGPRAIDVVSATSVPFDVSLVCADTFADIVDAAASGARRSSPAERRLLVANKQRKVLSRMGRAREANGRALSCVVEALGVVRIELSTDAQFVAKIVYGLAGRIGLSKAIDWAEQQHGTFPDRRRYRGDVAMHVLALHVKRGDAGTAIRLYDGGRAVTEGERWQFAKGNAACVGEAFARACEQSVAAMEFVWTAFCMRQLSWRLFDTERLLGAICEDVERYRWVRDHVEDFRAVCALEHVVGGDDDAVFAEWLADVRADPALLLPESLLRPHLHRRVVLAAAVRDPELRRRGTLDPTATLDLVWNVALQPEGGRLLEGVLCKYGNNDELVNEFARRLFVDDESPRCIHDLGSDDPTAHEVLYRRATACGEIGSDELVLPETTWRRHGLDIACHVPGCVEEIDLVMAITIGHTRLADVMLEYDPEMTHEAARKVADSLAWANMRNGPSGTDYDLLIEEAMYGLGALVWLCKRGHRPRLFQANAYGGVLRRQLPDLAERLGEDDIKTLVELFGQVSGRCLAELFGTDCISNRHASLVRVVRRLGVKAGDIAATV